MTTSDAVQLRQSALATQIATRVIFFIAGMGMSAWAPLVPYAKTRVNLSDASLGGLLLFLGVGSLVAMPLTGMLAGKYGCKAVIVTAGLFIMLVLPLLAVSPTPFTLALCLMAFGASIGVLDVAMNIQAVEVEKASGRAMMSGFHGFFSIGGIAGAGLVSAMLWLGLSPLNAVLMIAALIILLLLSSQKYLLSDRLHQSDSPLFVLPRGWVLFLGALCFILFLAEGAILDWGALFLTNVRDMPASQAGLGYAVFSIAMTIGRLTGDRIVNSFGSATILLLGSLCAAAGILLAVSVNDVRVTLLAFLLVGFGASNTVPILFSAAGKQETMPVNLAISAMTTIGYAGILAGPALVGFVSQWFSLTTAFSAIAVLLLAVAASARLVTR
ncbi:MFS transporter [Winslowiella iniecta]|uniref:MFS transporter n=1 Tax=Winslowiella iniecta TaxID=1560201 RepID=A0A0L7T3B7_9GAMM|nr:MFS transporter [Winslowiella iniecta]KOC89882.1 MFS transporter [Winslowiella iniecta]KOC92602.1 MFS transporter [Winslowiella iniecta]